MLQFGCFPLVLLFSNPLFPVPILWYHCHFHVPEFSLLKFRTYLSFWFHSVLSCGQPERHYYYYYYHFTSWESFESALADGLSLEFKWLQISLSLEDCYQHSARPQQCCSIDGLHSTSYLQVLQSFNQSFDDCTKSTNYSWYNRYFHVPQFFRFNCKVQVLILLLAFFQFYFVVRRDSKVHNYTRSLFLLIIIRFGRLAKIRLTVCILKSQSLCVSFSRIESGLCI